MSPIQILDFLWMAQLKSMRRSLGFPPLSRPISSLPVLPLLLVTFAASGPLRSPPSGPGFLGLGTAGILGPDPFFTVGTVQWTIE